MDQVIDIDAIANALSAMEQRSLPRQQSVCEARNPARTWAKHNAGSKKDQFDVPLTAQLKQCPFRLNFGIVIGQDLLIAQCAGLIRAWLRHLPVDRSTTQ